MNHIADNIPSDIAKMFNNKKVVITGGMGFIGSNLAHVLVGLGAKVIIYDALMPPYGGNKHNIVGIEKDLEMVDGDVRDADSLRKIMTGADYVWHLAGQVSYLDSRERPFDDLDFNGRGTLTVLEVVKNEAPEAKVLFSSSRLVYGKTLTLPVREDHPTNPLSLYGIHKLLGEKYMRYYSHEMGLNTCSLRIPNPYGPRQQMKHGKYSIVGWFVRQAMDGQELTIYGDGKQERDYLYIDDLTDAFLRLAVKGKSGEVYNVGTHERVRFVDMVNAVLKEVGSGTKKHMAWPKDYEKNETGDYVADTTKLQKRTKWDANISLKEGVEKMVAFYRQNKVKYW